MVAAFDDAGEDEHRSCLVGFRGSLGGAVVDGPPGFGGGLADELEDGGNPGTGFFVLGLEFVAGDRDGVWPDGLAETWGGGGREGFDTGVAEHGGDDFPAGP